jgi:hypothetical protein
LYTGVVISNAPKSFIVVEGAPAAPFCFAINLIPVSQPILPAASLLAAKPGIQSSKGRLDKTIKFYDQVNRTDRSILLAPASHSCAGSP